MADQNQIPGSFRTLKTDLASTDTNPQDRLQQAGNFMQARPKTDDDAPKPYEPTIQDVEPKVQSNYSWTNMDIAPAKLNESNPKPTISTDSEDKSRAKLSALDDNIDLPMVKNIEPPVNNNINLSLNKNIEPPVNNNINLSLNKNIEPPVNNNINLSLNKNTEPPVDSKIQLPLDSNLKSINPSFGKDNNPINDQADDLSDSKKDISNPNNQFDINSLDLQDDMKDVKHKSSGKGLLSIGIVIILLGLIGGGVYLYFNIDSSNNSVNPNNASVNPESTPTATPPSNSKSNPLLSASSKVDISFSDSEPIRKTISTNLTDKKDTLIELNLIKDNNPVSLIDTASALGITIPSIDTIKNYNFYAYNQQGVYKLICVLGLSSDQDANQFVDSWSSAIPRDLAAFSISLPSRIVNTPQVKESIITNSNTGKEFKNYYYNYTSSADSVDVSSYENYILIASSQESMLYTLDQIK
ncbi:MAG: hypothetical protein ACO3TG_00040 [Minisyncoccia bacterium]